MWRETWSWSVLETSPCQVACRHRGRHKEPVGRPARNGPAPVAPARAHAPHAPPRKEGRHLQSTVPRVLRVPAGESPRVRPEAKLAPHFDLRALGP